MRELARAAWSGAVGRRTRRVRQDAPPWPGRGEPRAGSATRRSQAKNRAFRPEMMAAAGEGLVRRGFSG